MNRKLYRAALAGLAAFLMLVLAGCFEGGEPSAEPSTSGSPGPSSARPEELRVLDELGGLALVDWYRLDCVSSSDDWRETVHASQLDECTKLAVAGKWSEDRESFQGGLRAFDAAGNEVVLPPETELVYERATVAEHSDAWAARLTVVDRTVTGNGFTCPRGALLYADFGSRAIDGMQMTYIDALASAEVIADMDHLDRLERGPSEATVEEEREWERFVNDIVPPLSCRG